MDSNNTGNNTNNNEDSKKINRLIKQLKECWDNPISWFSEKLHKFCGKKQKLALLIVFAIMAIFIALLIEKNINGTTTINLIGTNNTTYTGYIESDRTTSWASLFIDLAALPLLFVTLMFSAHGAYGNDEYQQEETNNMQTIIYKIEKVIEDTESLKNDYAELLSVKNDKKANSDISADNANIDNSDNSSDTPDSPPEPDG